LRTFGLFSENSALKIPPKNNLIDKAVTLAYNSNIISDGIISGCCNALSGRSEVESIKRAVVAGHAKLVTAVR
jgi:hypothetical protein